MLALYLSGQRCGGVVVQCSFFLVAELRLDMSLVVLQSAPALPQSPNSYQPFLGRLSLPVYLIHPLVITVRPVHGFHNSLYHESITARRMPASKSHLEVHDGSLHLQRLVDCREYCLRTIVWPLAPAPSATGVQGVL
jgi:hypothetical protein